MLINKLIFYFSAGALLLLPAVSSPDVSKMADTKHNLSFSGPGPIKSSTESRICVFCHTPHSATPATPLWNKELRPQNYTTYENSPTLRTPQPLPQPTGSTKLCLSCHDGTIALGTVASGANLGLNTSLSPGNPAYFGLDLSTHHPVSFLYSSSLPNPGLVDFGTVKSSLLFEGAGFLQCNTCHDPHDDSRGMFLVMDNRFSALCLTCHIIFNWSGSAHATSSAPVAGILPVPPKTRPNWSTVAEWGCEVCHEPHFALAVPLLNYASEEYCLNCHSDMGPFPHAQSLSEQRTGLQKRLKSSYSAGKGADIKGQMRKRYGHHLQIGGGITPTRLARGRLRVMDGTVKCADCHNPHTVNRQTASAPDVSGMTRGVSGVDRDGMQKTFANYEYELCFKCHEDSIPRGRRVVESNLRLAFYPGNPSYHPVIEMGKGFNVPSLVSRKESFSADSRLIYCTDCHRDDSGVSRGPHGSSFPAILGERYETADHTTESYQSYALCYSCHDRNSILRDDSFRRARNSRGGHSGHLAAGAPCSACHDPHGVVDDRMSGSHTHLINFDKRIVSPMPRTADPFFTDTGTFSGSCTLVCHGKTHTNESYP